MVEEKNKKGLGRGLMSLFGDQVESTNIEQESLQKKIPNNSYLLASISDLRPSKFQPRKFFDEKKIKICLISMKIFLLIVHHH